MVYFGLCLNLSSPRALGLAPSPSPLHFVQWTTHPILSPQLYFYLPHKTISRRRKPSKCLSPPPHFVLSHSLFDGLPSFLLGHCSFPSVYLIGSLPFTRVPRPLSHWIYVAKEEMISVPPCEKRQLLRLVPGSAVEFHSTTFLLALRVRYAGAPVYPRRGRCHLEVASIGTDNAGSPPNYTGFRNQEHGVDWE